MNFLNMMPSFLPQLDLGQAIQTVVYSSMETLARNWHHHGETNRYSKEPIELSDGPPIEKPSASGTLQYQLHHYSPLYKEGSGDSLHGEKPVRLLELLPPGVTNSELIRCKLHPYSLDQAPEYEAISYTWGVVNTQDFPVIVVPDSAGRGDALEPACLEAIEITRHLYAALKNLRHPTQSRLLWADQICINQVDKGEKSKQVRQMGNIYKKSKRTAIWLGEEDSDKDVISEMFTLLASKPHASVEDDFNMFKGLLDLEESASHTTSRKQWRRQAVTRLLNRTWFSRVWVFQEAVVSPEVEFIYGSLKLPLKELFRITRAVFEVENATGGYARSIAKRTVGFDTLYLVQHSRGKCGDPSCPRDKVPRTFFGLVMQALQQLHATKELDLIYAFIGFESPDANPKIEPNYKLPVRTVWMNAASTIIQNSHSLDIFAAARGDAECEYDLPSWVPDFSRCYPYARPITAPDFITAFDAAGGLPHVWKGPVDAEVLTVVGKVVGTIMWLSPVNFGLKFHRQEAKGTKAVLDYEAHAAGMAGYIDIQGTITREKREELLGGPQINYHTIVRTLLADGAFGNEQPLSYPMEEIIRVCENEDAIQAANDAAGSRLGDADYQILEKLREWGLIVQQKRLFLSDKHDMGLVPKTANKGDLICLLHGSKVPCVLRPTGTGEERYRVISQCYLDGMMNFNKSLERKALLEEGVQEFVLV